MPGRRRGGRPTGPAPLPVGSHNVRLLLGTADHGVGAPLTALARCWERQHLDVVCLQETHLRDADVPRAQTLLTTVCRSERFGNWSSWWCPAVESACGRPGEWLCSPGPVSSPRGLSSSLVAPPPPSPVRMAACSTCQSSGAATSSPSSRRISQDCSLQRAVIDQRLRPLAAAGGMHVWTADFNFVMAPDVDAQGSGRARDVPTARLFGTACPGFVDCFRHLHPSLRGYTFFHARGASRQDRVVVSP